MKTNNYRGYEYKIDFDNASGSYFGEIRKSGDADGKPLLTGYSHTVADAVGLCRVAIDWIAGQQNRKEKVA